MSNKTPKFQKAQDFLINRVKLGPILKRIGISVDLKIDKDPSQSASLLNGASLVKLVHQAKERTAQIYRSNLSELTDDVEAIKMEFYFAQSEKLTPQEQVDLFMQAPHAASVAFAAAKQIHVPKLLQETLIKYAYHHADAMRELADNPRIHPETLIPLASHPSRDVRLSVAEHIGPRMRVHEPSLEKYKDEVFNNIIENYEDSFAGYIIPVCRDEEQLERIFNRTKILVPSNVALFTDNPYSSNDILLKVVSSDSIGLMPGGRKLKKQALDLINKRLSQDKDYDDNDSLTI